VHQISLKDFGSQNISFLAPKAEPVGEVQILRTATVTARDRRIFFYRLNHVIYSYEVLKNENQPFFFIFLDTKPILPSYSICGK
jgi:hypothetical protein